jgi:hypothetical protein
MLERVALLPLWALAEAQARPGRTGTADIRGDLDQAGNPESFRGQIGATLRTRGGRGVWPLRATRFKYFNTFLNSR